MDRFVNALQRYGIGRLAAILGVAAGVAAVLFAVVLNFGSAPMSLLYSNVDPKEAASITQVLDQSGVKYKVVGDGSTIMVERDKVSATRNALAMKNLPTSGSIGYELLDQASPLGQTEQQWNLNEKRATEGELARNVRAIGGVTYARVQLVQPKRAMFADEASPPTAMVLVGSNRALAADQVRGLQNMIAAAVPNLKADAVTVVDQASGKTLAGGQGDGAAGAMAEERRNQTEDAIKRKVKETVEGVVGPGRSRVNVTAVLDLSRVTVQEEKFDPDGQVALSTENIQETASEKQAGANGQVTTANNLPGADTGAGSTTTGNDSGSTHETTNYALSKTTRTEIQEPGTIKKLSVSVAVDWIAPLGANGKAMAARPLTADERTNLQKLVESAVGFDATRGDVVTVANTRFMRDPSLEGGAVAKSPLGAFDKNDIMRAGELGVLLIVVGLIIFYVVRPLLKTASGSGGGFSPMPMLAGGGGQGMSLQGGPMTMESQGQQKALPQPADDSRIDIARIEGQVKASAVKQVSDFVERHPEESVSILRSWLHEG